MYVRWIGVPVAVLTCVGLIGLLFAINIVLGVIGALFIGCFIEVLLRGAYSKSSALGDHS